MIGSSNHTQDLPRTRRAKKLSRWIFSIIMGLLLIVMVLVSIVLNPGLFYDHKRSVGTLQVHYNGTIPPVFDKRLRDAVSLCQRSEVYDSAFKLKICVGRSLYPSLIRRMMGNGFAWGFFNTVVVNGDLDPATDHHQSGWNLTQLLAHEMTHCYQYKKLGLRKSNPVAGHPGWKWEGYAEYVARRDVGQSLREGIISGLGAEQGNSNGWIDLPGGSRTTLGYHRYWLLVRYSIEEKRMTFFELLKDTKTLDAVNADMMSWHSSQNDSLTAAR